MDPQATVTDNPSQSRFEIHEGADLAGFAQYHACKDEIAFLHTEIGQRSGAAASPACSSTAPSTRPGNAASRFELAPQQDRARFGL
jgi:hypothetical protein